MPSTMYNTNFLETPDPVTGLQRRTGQNFLDHKQTIHERITLEHVFDPSASSPQNAHGTHRKGSAIPYVTALGEALPTNRPTGEDKTGVAIPAIPLGTGDAGRLCWHEGSKLMVWTGTAWQKADTSPAGAIMLWPSVTAPDSFYWAKCNGSLLTAADYPDLAAVLGSAGGSITLPNMQGISTVGAGNFTNFNGTGRTKGSGQLPGTLVEDQLQTFGGQVRANGVYEEGSLFNEVTGIFKLLAKTTSSWRRLDRQTDGDNSVLAIDLTADSSIRHGAELRASAYVVDYYIKKR